MVSFRFASAIVAVALSTMASAADSSTPTSTVISYTVAPTEVAVKTMVTIGCFNTSTPLEDHGAYDHQSRGNCQFICAWLNKNVMALSDGTNCWCGDLFPAKNSQVDNSTCDTTCGGTGSETCGGPGLLWVQTTGQSLNKIANYVPPVSSSTTTPAAVAQSTQSPGTIQTATDTATSAANSGSSGGPNKVGIAVGVVVGVLVLLGVIAGVFFFMRHKRRREVEEEFRRQANINSFTAGGKLHTSNSSMTDSRLDPEFMNRRASNGSIADNEDYSRRILKVTNA